MKHNKKIIISPAILESDLNTFEGELNLYVNFAKQVDVDINIANDLFEGNVTTASDQVVQILKKTPEDLKFGIHLMVSEPLKEIVKFKELGLLEKCVFYLQQETKIGEVLDYKERDRLSLALSIKAETPFKGLEFYNEFDEIQLMTVQIGFQGGKFIPEVLDRVEYLKENGYKGKISIDGGVNLKTAELIREHALDRVSVGSYFSKSENLELDWMKLDLALNM
ncbi:MAG: hypothetical protein Q9M91_06450 [Candidatus Dojkabacteria bacterium]|nr:hypothetical protein [Candidatus Dojkabacteria bacterium]MDQ7021436.1 hypothetical protein [Candidatus Dojkabacteria bacterium]